MDTARAQEVLEAWIGEANALLDLVPDGRAVPPGDGVLALLEREDQIRRVVQRVLGLADLPTIVARYPSGNFGLSKGVDSVRYALARLKTDAETRAILGPTAPTMAADALHPVIWASTSSLWESNHFGQAVQRAATALNGYVQDRVNRHDVSDSVLMTEVFSDKEPQPGKPRLRWPGQEDDLTVKSMRAGLRLVAPGVFLTIRNPVSHDPKDMGRQDALERLATLSTVAHWIDACDVVVSSG